VSLRVVLSAASPRSYVAVGFPLQSLTQNANVKFENTQMINHQRAQMSMLQATRRSAEGKQCVESSARDSSVKSTDILTQVESFYIIHSNFISTTFNQSLSQP
jgi:hypothetical protein